MVTTTKHPKPNYRMMMERSLIASLMFIILLFLFFPIFERRSQKAEAIHLNIIVQDIPLTSHSTFRPPPPKPAIPIPSENEDIPLDETIEITELNLDNSPLSADGYQGVGTSFVPPRPIAEVIPEYPEEDFKNKVTGVVKLHVNIDELGKVIEVIILENTTKSKRCVEAAKAAAYKCRYIPAKQDNKNIPCWTTRVVTFDIPN